MSQLEKTDKFPVRLKRGYFPLDPDQPRNPNNPGSPLKLQAGTVVHLPKKEAAYLIDNGYAERADKIPL